MLLEVIKKLVSTKKAEMENHRKVYTGGFRENGEWERDSLSLLYPEVAVVDVPTKKVRPAIKNKKFIGGNSHRVVYLAVEEFMAKYPRLGEWWESKGDSHLLASMFLRPGKLAMRQNKITLPARTDEEANDGVLATLSKQAWRDFVDMMGLPKDATWAQVTVFAPEYGVVAKGSIRRALPGEQPATYTHSWKNLPDDVNTLQHTHVGVLETDATYRPRASINLQEFTYWVKGRNTRLAPWVMQVIAREQQRILTEEKSSPMTTWGYLQKLGLPSPDELLGEVIEGQQGALYDLLGRWPVPATHGWRGKVSGSTRVSETEQVREILLPKGCGNIGDTVYVSRNPALAVNGWVRYKVVGHVEGNVAYVSGRPGTAFNAVLGGDFDGDDIVVLFRCPVEQFTDVSDEVNLQEWKASGRAFGSQTIEERIARWKKEVTSNIGRWDILARYAVDLGLADSQVKEELAKLVQFTISLKKRVGELEVPEDIKRLATEVAPVKEFTPTYLLRGYVEMDRAEREMLKEVLGNQLGQLEEVLKLVEDGLEAIRMDRPRWSLKAAIEVAKRIEVKPELMEAAKEFFKQYASLAKAKLEASQANDGDLKSQLGREARYLTQVVMPEYMLGLSEEDAVTFSAALVRVNQAADWWLFAAHPKFVEKILKETFAAEKAMLVGEHNLQVGDEVVIPAGVREVEVGGKVLKLSNGIMLFEGEAVAKVVKVYPKSVVLDFGGTKTATKTKVSVSLLDF